MTFDLEKARALAYQASEFKVWTPPGATGHDADLSKHREWQAVVEICDKRYPESLDQITDLMQNCNSLRARAQKAEAEIERLRADNTGLSKAVIDIQEERDLAQAEFRAYHKAWEEQAARIKELEDALVEERANANRSGTGNILMSYLRENNIDPEKYFSEKATEQLRAEGKIGSGDHIPGTTKKDEEAGQE